MRDMAERPQPIADLDGETHRGQHRPTIIDGANGAKQSWCGYCALYERKMMAWSAGQVDWSRFGR